MALVLTFAAELKDKTDASKPVETDSPAPDAAHANPAASTNIQSDPATPGNVAIQPQDGYES